MVRQPKPVLFCAATAGLGFDRVRAAKRQAKATAVHPEHGGLGGGAAPDAYAYWAGR
jgi:hypothetical protein